ncbi:transmembrane and immunoglobulin domain-containing protein 2 [Ctenodactylus gundi]
MRSPGSVLVLLVQFWALQEASSLSVQQWPSSLRVTQGDRATLACQVTPARAWERLRVEWTKDRDVMCQLFVTNGSLSPRTCRPRGQPSWQAPGGLTLQLDHVTVNESGSYVCQATIEIPELEKAEGTGTQLLVDADGVEEHVTQTPRISGLLVLLAAGAVAMTSVTLGAVIWARRSCRARDSGEPS